MHCVGADRPRAPSRLLLRAGQPTDAQGRSALHQVLEQRMLGAHENSMVSIGVHCVSDLLGLVDKDFEQLELNRFDHARCQTLIDELAGNKSLSVCCESSVRS
eukprot:SAG11_NODE_10221_length_846_cov_0.931727_2_plen_103_part_00